MTSSPRFKVRDRVQIRHGLGGNRGGTKGVVVEVHPRTCHRDTAGDRLVWPEPHVYLIDFGSPKDYEELEESVLEPLPN